MINAKVQKSRDYKRDGRGKRAGAQGNGKGTAGGRAVGKVDRIRGGGRPREVDGAVLVVRSPVKGAEAVLAPIPALSNSNSAKN